MSIESSMITSLALSQLIALKQQVSALGIRRKHIRSPLNGGHVSRLRGRGMEFEEVRAYQAGDELSSIDWKVTARTGKTHTKIFREERERPVLICLDYRKAMFFATQGALKSVIASKAAALLAWHGVAHGDRLGAYLFSDDDHQEIRPTRGRKGVLKLLHGCCQSKAWQGQHEASTSPSMQAMTQRLRHIRQTGSLVYILSDFRGLDDESMGHLAVLARHNDVVLVHIYDAIEANFPASGTFPVFDGKQHFMCYADATMQGVLHAQYQQRMESLEHLQKQYGMHLIHLQTHDDVAQIIRERLWAL
ncbi:MAG: DUF58 domain-containing protein [Mariprofundaceae bacterium]|nr:DUF58 domain-containing protein [Mariprofundaceae bacterium]